MKAIKIHNKMSDPEVNDVIAIWITRTRKLYILNNSQAFNISGRLIKSYELAQEMRKRTTALVGFASLRNLHQSEVIGHEIAGVSIQNPRPKKK